MKERPEETIRSHLVQTMIEELNFPKALIVLEKELKTLPHLSLQEKKRVPRRRIDVVVFTKKEDNFFPLLLIECKIASFDKKHFRQLIGYNDIVKAPFIALANAESIITGAYEGGEYFFTKGLLDYFSLNESIRIDAIPQ